MINLPLKLNFLSANIHRTMYVYNGALQAKKYPDINMLTAITQIAGRQVAEKIPSWREIEEIWYRNICR